MQVIAAPLIAEGRFRHVLRDAATGRVLAAWPEDEQAVEGGVQLVYQQVGAWGF